MTRLQPVLRYPGSKHRIAAWITAQFPRHRIYCEPFCGSLTVLFAKPRSPLEIVNDRDGRICGLFRVLRDQPAALIRLIALTPFARDEFRSCQELSADPVEDARRVLVRCWQSVGSIYSTRTGWKLDSRPRKPASLVWAKLPERLAAVVERLQGVQIENCDALDLMGRLNEADVLHYLDPPYPETVRRAQLYAEEMPSPADHEVLLAAARAHPGPVIISSYDNRLYQDMLGDWECRRIRAFALTGQERTECLWLNKAAAAGSQGDLFRAAREEAAHDP